MDQWHVELLSNAHDYAQFDCGKETLSNWLKSIARQFRKKDLAQTYVLVEPGQVIVLGYYSLAVSSVGFAEMPAATRKKLPQTMPIPVVLIGKLAVDKRIQGRGLGEFLFTDAIKRIAAVADQIGIQSIVIDAIDDEAKRFYLRYGCVAGEDQPLRLFYSIRDAHSSDDLAQNS